MLVDARVLIVGMGGLGCPVSLALARAGVGALTLVDPDVVDASNLPRQLWHRTRDVGRPKVESASARLRATFPELRLTSLQVPVDASNAETLFRSHALVVDATDDVRTKFLLSDTAVSTATPLVYGGVLRFEGQVMPIVQGGPCLRCLFESPADPEEVPTCAQAGVLGSVAGVVGALQAQVALECLGQPRWMSDGRAKLRIFDGLSLRTREVTVRRRKDCIVCGDAVSRSPRAAWAR
jgi:molybdopterin/thiamine biosynthesis adenylyltransferase